MRSDTLFAVKQFHKFIPLSRVEVQKDGTLHVFGLVTAEQLDRDNEICDYVKTKPFYEKTVEEMLKATSVEGMESSIMPLLEMHQLHAVGKGISINFDDEKKTIRMGFEVVEAAAIQKVKKGVLPCFSQGGAYVDRYPDPERKGVMRYVADPGEVSLVHRGSLPSAVIEAMKSHSIQLVKADGSTELVKLRAERVTLDESKHALAKMREEFAKGMYCVAQFAEVLDRLSWLRESLVDERAFEGDDSELPDELSTHLKELCAFFEELVAEETAELAAMAAKGAKMKPELEKILAKAAGGETLNAEELKKLAEEFKLLKDHLSAIHGHIKKAVAHHAAHHDRMHKDHEAHDGHLEKAMKACGAAMGDGKSAPAPEVKKISRAQAKVLGAADDVKEFEATVSGVVTKFEIVEEASAGTLTISKADVEKMIADGIEKAREAEGSKEAKLFVVERGEAPKAVKRTDPVPV